MEEFIFLSLQEYKNKISSGQRGVYRIVCLGESTNDFGYKSSYPYQLQDILNRRNMEIKFNVIDKGIQESKTGIIVSHFEDNLNKYKPDMVIIMMGIDDYSRDALHENIPKKITLFIKSLRINKFIKLLKLSIISKIREIGSYKRRKKREDISFKEIGLTQSISSERQEKLLRKSIEVKPKNDWAYIGLGELYRNRREIYKAEDKAEEMFRKAIELNPKNDWAYVGLGQLYWNIRESINAQAIIYKAEDKAEEMFRKAIEVNPKNDWAYVGLGWSYWFKDKYDKAEEMFRKAIELNPKNDWAYVELGWLYYIRKRHDKAEEMFRKAIEVNPKNDRAYVELGWSYWFKDKAEEMFRKAIELNPKNDWAYFGLGWYYRFKEKHAKAEEMFRKAIEVNPKEECLAYVELGWSYWFKEKHAKAEEMFRKAIEVNPKIERVSVGIKGFVPCIEGLGKYESNEKYIAKIKFPGTKYYNFIIQYNCRMIKEIVTKRGIKLIYVQYPLYSIEPLKKIFENKEGVIFVDNEIIFKEALKQASYDEYFIDTVGGNVGRCTPQGNRLLAESIANVILKECFN